MIRRINTQCLKYFVVYLLIVYVSMAQADVLIMPSQTILSTSANNASAMPMAQSTFRYDENTAANTGINLPDVLKKAPGLINRNRENYAQDIQLSNRGFGARTQFGVRGIRLNQDGIALTMPDGQGQPALIDLDQLEKIEVLRGPLASLYGNASGGVINAYSKPFPTSPTVSTRSLAGNDGLWRTRLNYAAQYEQLGLSAGIAHFQTQGFREHSKSERQTAQLKLGFNHADSTSFISFYSLYQPDTQDPLGLTKDQVKTKRTQSPVEAERFNSRKSVDHQQVALHHQTWLSDILLTATAHLGQRDMQQFLAFRGNSLSSGGGVIELERDFGGSEISLRKQGSWFDLASELNLGLSYQFQREQRLGFSNDFGTKGALMRNQRDDVASIEAYAIGQLQLTDTLTAIGGARLSQVRFRSDDEFFLDGQDDSGKRRFQALTPALGLSWQLSPSLTLYGALGRGFETPTTQELAYRTDGAGFNSQLKPSHARNLEVGVKWLGDTRQIELALFQSQLRDEIVVGANQAVTGRATYTNAARSKRQGLELSVEQTLTDTLQLAVAYSYLHARYQAFATAQNEDFSHNQVPGTAKHNVYAELTWQPRTQGLVTALEMESLSRRYASDNNLHHAPGYVIVNWRASWPMASANSTFTPFVRVNNLFNRPYMGSVIVNASAERFYEPAPLRTLLVGVGIDF